MRQARRSFNLGTLAALRQLPSDAVLERLAITAKADPTYHPLKAATTQRWHVRTIRGEFEIPTTGPKWYDTRARKGGGGGIGLTMHILQLSFVDAVRLLLKEAHGSDHS